MQPNSIKKFDLLYLGAVALGLINGVLSYGMMKAELEAQLAGTGIEVGMGSLIGGLAFSLVISLALWYLVSRLRIELVKWVMLAFLAFGLIGLPALFVNGFQFTDIIAIIVFAMQAAAIYFLFQPDAKAWFAEKNGPIDPK